MRFGSLFSGIGGFDLGFERAGMECVWQVEIDKDCQRVLSKHFPDSERFEDVSTVREFPAVDVICGGFPCQDLSVAGKRKGLAGERSGLWFEFLRIAQSNLPRFLVIENVPGLLSSDEGRDFAVILRGLVECGYCLAWRIIDAQYDGVAQRRRRVFIVGSLGNGSCAEILFESESVSWNPPTRREAGQRATGIARTSPTLGESNYKPTKSTSGAQVDFCIPMASARMTAFGEYVDDDSASSLKQRDFKDATDLIVTNCFNGYTGGADDNDAQGNHIVAQAIDIRNLKMQPDANSGALSSKKSGGYSLNYQNPVLAFEPRYFTRDNKTGGAPDEVTGITNAHKSGDSVPVVFESRIARNGRGAPEEIVPPLKAESGQTGKGGSAPLTAGTFGVRRLTPRECERLQGFPDDWTRYDASGKEISDSARYRMLGNAVAVPCAYWIGRRILEAAEGKI